MKKSRQQSYVYKKTKEYVEWPEYMWMTREKENGEYVHVIRCEDSGKPPLVPYSTQWLTLLKGVDHWWLREKEDAKIEMILPGEFLT